jgi:hypothetical protein
MFYHACFWYGVFVWFSSVFRGFWFVCANFSAPVLDNCLLISVLQMRLFKFKNILAKVCFVSV